MSTTIYLHVRWCEKHNAHCTEACVYPFTIQTKCSLWWNKKPKSIAFGFNFNSFSTFLKYCLQHISISYHTRSCFSFNKWMHFQTFCFLLFFFYEVHTLVKYQQPAFYFNFKWKKNNERCELITDQIFNQFIAIKLLIYYSISLMNAMHRCSQFSKQTTTKNG